MPYVYLLECADGTFYTGWTTDLEERIKAHNEGKGARYTAGQGPVRLIYWEHHATRQEAQRREIMVKRFSRAQKKLWQLKAKLWYNLVKNKRF